MTDKVKNGGDEGIPKRYIGISRMHALMGDALIEQAKTDEALKSELEGYLNWLEGGKDRAERKVKREALLAKKAEIEDAFSEVFQMYEDEFPVLEVSRDAEGEITVKIPGLRKASTGDGSGFRGQPLQDSEDESIVYASGAKAIRDILEEDEWKKPRNMQTVLRDLKKAGRTFQKITKEKYEAAIAANSDE